MNATFPNLTLQEELVTLLRLRISKDYQARHPATDPRLAIEAEKSRDALDLKIADITAKIQDAQIIPFPNRQKPGRQKTEDKKSASSSALLPFVSKSYIQ